MILSQKNGTLSFSIKTKLFLPIFLLMVFQVNAQVYDQFSLESFRIAIKEKDTLKIRTMILSIGDNCLTDSEFFSRVADIGSETGFVFGVIDPTEMPWKGFSSKRKEVIKQNIFSVFSLYVSSCIFLKEVEWDHLDSFQSEFYNNKRLYSTEEKLKIWYALNALVNINN